MSVKHAILALLYRQPMHGYEIGKQLAAQVSAEWDVKPAQIASTLTRLHDADLVEYEIVSGADAPDRKVFRLSAAGLEALRDWYLRPEVREYHLSDTFYIKLVLSLTGGPVPAEHVLMIQRRELYQELHQVTELRRKADPHTEMPWVLLLESAMMHLEADIRWLEMVEAHMPALQRYTPVLPVPRPRGRPRRMTLETT